MKTTKLLMLLVATCLMAACGGDDETVAPVPTTSTVVLQLGLPEGIDNGMLSEVSVVTYDVNTGREQTQQVTVGSSGQASLVLARGLYRITVYATLTYRNERGNEKQVTVQAYDGAVEVTSSTLTCQLPLFVTSQPEPDPIDDPAYQYTGFVLAEIFCAGSASPQGSYYYADKYFVIYNNTDHVLYADSLLIAESDFLTTMKEEYTPDIMSTDLAVGALYMIPGSGQDVPVQPGGRILLVDNAVNHTVANPNSWDMTVADYEWYDESTNPDYTDIDNPNVKNLERIYSKTLTMWSPHTQGFKSYALARMHTDVRTYLINYAYDYDYHVVGLTGEADLTGNSYRLPNSWILDAVNMSVPAMFQWIVTAPSLDRGYTYCANVGWEISRYNKSVRRKVASRDGNRAVLQDTNNSTDDFEPRVEADPFHVF